MKKTTNRKLFIYAEEQAEAEEKSKRRKESMRRFPTLFKVDPTIVDECTEEILLERAEEKRIRRINEAKEEGEKKLKMSTHTEGAIKPVAIRRFSRFITCHVRQKFGAARRISYYSLFRGLGTGSIKEARFLFKKKFKDRNLKDQVEWDWPKIDLIEVQKYGRCGLQYEREELEMIPINKKRLIKIEPVQEEEEKEMLDVIDEEGEAEIAAKRSLHFQRGHLRDFEIEKVAVDTKKETNTTVVEDQMSIRPQTHYMPEEMQEETPEETPEESLLLDIEEKGIFECSVCFSRFGLLTELREHKIECDKAEKKFECRICGNRFILEKSRDFHYEKICLKRLQEDERKRKEAEKKKQDEEDAGGGG